METTISISVAVVLQAITLIGTCITVGAWVIRKTWQLTKKINSVLNRIVDLEEANIQGNEDTKVIFSSLLTCFKTLEIQHQLIPGAPGAKLLGSAIGDLEKHIIGGHQ